MKARLLKSALGDGWTVTQYRAGKGGLVKVCQWKFREYRPALRFHAELQEALKESA